MCKCHPRKVYQEYARVQFNIRQIIDSARKALRNMPDVIAGVSVSASSGSNSNRIVSFATFPEFSALEGFLSICGDLTKVNYVAIEMLGDEGWPVRAFFEHLELTAPTVEILRIGTNGGIQYWDVKQVLDCIDQNQPVAAQRLLACA
jgi:hypothetical protein